MIPTLAIGGGLVVALVITHRQAAARMLAVGTEGSPESPLGSAEEARPALVLTEILLITVVVFVALVVGEMGSALRVGVVAIVSTLGLLVLSPAPAVTPGSSPAWIRLASRLLPRGMGGEEPPRSPAPADPFDERVLLDRVMKFGETELTEIMVPRIDIVGVEAGEDVRALVGRVEEHRHSRYPVYRTDLDHVLGVVSVFDLLKLAPEDRDFRPLISAMLIAPEGKNCDDLLDEMLTTGREFAIVVDEFGGTAGLVTVEDLVEELVGEIWDEHEREAIELRRVGRHAWVARATVSLEDIDDELGLSLPEGDYETLAGFLLEQFGRIPVRGDTVTWRQATFEVLTADRRRIESVQITLNSPGGR